MAKKTMAFDFVLDSLHALNPVVKPMFGCHAVYVGTKIVLVTRNKEDHQYDNGVWIATTPEHHASLRKDFPMMRSIELLGYGETSWQNIPSNSEVFEESVQKACDFIRSGDKRIGKVPNPESESTNSPG